MNKKLTLNDIFTAALIAELGATRTGKVAIDLGELLREPMMAAGVSLEEVNLSFGDLIRSTEAVAELLPSEETVGGGFGRVFLEKVAEQDLSFLADDNRGWLADELLLEVLLRDISQETAQEAINFVAENISVEAATAIKRELEDYGERARNLDPDEFVEHLRNVIDVDLRGPTASQKRLGGQRAVRILATVLGGDALKEVFKDLRLPTLGDAWRMKEVPWGLPDNIVEYLRRNPVADEHINMDAVRELRLRDLKDMKSLEAITEERHQETPEALGHVKKIFHLAKVATEELFGSIEAAEQEVGEWAGKRLPEPTPGCDCIGCRLLKEQKASAEEELVTPGMEN